MKFDTLIGAIVSLGVMCGVTHANTIILNSQPGLFNSINAATVAITRHSAWQANNPLNSSAVWISYAETGYGDPAFQPYNGQAPVVSIFHGFTSAAGFLSLSIWADDTAEVLLDGVTLFEPKFTQNTCSGQPIGCRPQDLGIIDAPLSAGIHKLEFRLFQVGTGTDSAGNPFGLLYTGTATATPTPEPGTLALAGTVLLAIAGKRKWSRRRSVPASVNA